MSIHLTHPLYLAALLVLPLIVLLGRRSLAGLGSARHALAVSVRCLLVITLVLALAGPEAVRTTDDQTVAFAVDLSDSVPAERRADAGTFIERATGTMRPEHDRATLLTFAGGPQIEQLATHEPAPLRAGTPPEPHRTDIAAAVRTSVALLPGDTAGRIVVLSDGDENRGIATAEADACAALGIPIDVVPLRYEHAGEILVEQLSAPATLSAAESTRLQLVLRAQQATRARLLLYRNDQPVDLDPEAATLAMHLDLPAGPSRWTIPVDLPRAGLHRFHAVVEPVAPGGDAIAANNEGRAFTLVGPAERVVIVIAERSGLALRSGLVLADALRRQDIECTVQTVDELPDGPAGLADCAAVILSNVSAMRLGSARQNMLAAYVREQGGGLIVIGGDEAFSVGGYAHTPLEAILPVETARDKLNLLSLGMVLVIDRSGSMNGSKIDMARQAALAAVRLLSDQDRIGVLAFDTKPEWIAAPQPAEQRDAINRRIATIFSGGGTDIAPALAMARQALSPIDTNLRHIILLTDGQSSAGPLRELAETCRTDGITITTIAVGPDADQALLADVARISGGRMYQATDGQPLPQIFARETVLASRAGLYERPFVPRLVSEPGHAILAGLDPADIPPLGGCVVTAARPLASTPLVRETEDGRDPILAHWQVGLGRTVAFTSGLWPKWGPDWVNWPGFPRVWAQAVRWVARAGNHGGLQVATVVEDGVARISIAPGLLAPAEFDTLEIAGRVTLPDFSTAPVSVTRTGVDRFDVTVPLEAPGTYLVELPYARPGSSGVLRTAVTQAYAPEYRTIRDDHATLAELARRTGGRILPLDRPDAVFEASSIRPIAVRRAVWDNLVLLALIVFLIDVAVRRIAIGPRAATAALRGRLRVAGASGESAAATLGVLRAAQRRDAGFAVSEPLPPGADPAAGADRQPKPVTGSADEESAAARLLRTKRRLRERHEDGGSATSS